MASGGPTSDHMLEGGGAFNGLFRALLLKRLKGPTVHIKCEAGQPAESLEVKL